MFHAFICASNIGSLVNNLFGVNIFNPFPSFTSFSWPSSGGVSINSSESSPSYDVSVKSLSTDFFYPLDFTLLAITFSGCDLVFSSS